MNKKLFRIMCHVICALSFLCAAGSVWAQALDSGDFSVDNLSPEVPGPFNGKAWNASDILKFTGSDVLVLGSFLFPQGFPMSPFDEIDAITTGQDRLMVPGPGFHLALEYSVGRNSLGLGDPVSRQRGLNGNGWRQISSLSDASGQKNRTIPGVGCAESQSDPSAAVRV